MPNIAAILSTNKQKVKKDPLKNLNGTSLFSIPEITTHQVPQKHHHKAESYQMLNKNSSEKNFLRVKENYDPFSEQNSLNFDTNNVSTNKSIQNKNYMNPSLGVIISEEESNSKSKGRVNTFQSKR